jgi:hypothetical protein
VQETCGSAAALAALEAAVVVLNVSPARAVKFWLAMPHDERVAWMYREYGETLLRGAAWGRRCPLVALRCRLREAGLC